MEEKMPKFNFDNFLARETSELAFWFTLLDEFTAETFQWKLLLDDDAMIDFDSIAMSR